ncbi:alpha/beta hydrolase family protein [Yasminevirus sp. GU-2018]|uniref:Alpha/beta hydrolase family protein n=1 Tax=Yasminevirus sp. GU-2018 TaxID=2420051 RepID=A0A5K0U7S3_9VIRU|nr:alpha/beta hydrolase family protein [Yasminevirus sp. GU-2018]
MTQNSIVSTALFTTTTISTIFCVAGIATLICTSLLLLWTVYRIITKRSIPVVDFARRCMDYPFIKLTEYIMFRPEKLDDELYTRWMSHSHVLNEKIKTKDGHTLDACLYRYDRQPSYSDDLIYLYSHGNSGWLGLVLESPTCRYLSKRATLFIYDYRGYGKSEGSPSEDGLLSDALSAWEFLVYKKNVDPKKIVLFGHSLGTSITAHLALHHVKTKTTFSNVLVLQNGFESVRRVISDHSPVGGWFVKSKLNTKNFLKEIDTLTKDIRIVVIHSKDDKLIHVNHSHNLVNSMNSNDVKLLTVEGDHDEAKYDDNVHEHLSKLHDSL